MASWLVYILGGSTAIMSSLMGAFSGGGASFILFPILLSFAPFPYASLLAITKVSAMVLTVVSGKIHFSKNKLDLKLLAALIIGGILGTALGTYFLQYQFNENLFKKLLGIFLIFTAIYLFFTENKKQSEEVKENLTFMKYCQAFFVTFLISVFNGLFGGTGILMTIYLMIFLRMSFIRASAYTMSSSAFINITQSTYLLATEPVNIYLLIAVVCGSFIGSLLGTKLQYLKGSMIAKRASILMMIFIGVNMIFR